MLGREKSQYKFQMSFQEKVFLAETYYFNVMNTAQFQKRKILLPWVDVCVYIDISKYTPQNVKEHSSYEVDGENLSNLPN